MATSCAFQAPNGNKSILFKRLEVLYGTDKATEVWNMVRTPEWQKEHGWWTESAPAIGKINPVFKPQGGDFSDSPIRFTKSVSNDYRARTTENIKGSDATLHIITDPGTLGEKLTAAEAAKNKKGYRAVTYGENAVDDIVNMLNAHNVQVLNIAGNGIYDIKDSQEVVDDKVLTLLREVLTHPNLVTPVKVIRTGGQTGMDEAGAKAGIKLGIPTIIHSTSDWKLRPFDKKDRSNESLFKSRFDGLKTEFPVELLRAHRLIEANGLAAIKNYKAPASTSSIDYRSWTPTKLYAAIDKAALIPSDPYEAALRHFALGGTVHWETFLTEVLGQKLPRNAKRADFDEVKVRKTILSERETRPGNPVSPENVGEYISGSQISDGSFDSQQARDAIIDVLGDFNTRHEIALEYAEKFLVEEQDAYQEDIQETQPTNDSVYIVKAYLASNPDSDLAKAIDKAKTPRGWDKEVWEDKLIDQVALSLPQVANKEGILEYRKKAPYWENTKNNLVGAEMDFEVGSDPTRADAPYEHRLRIDKLSLLPNGNYRIMATNLTNGNTYDMTTTDGGNVVAYRRDGKERVDSDETPITDAIEFPLGSFVEAVPDEIITIDLNKNAGTVAPSARATDLVKPVMVKKGLVKLSKDKIGKDQGKADYANAYIGYGVSRAAGPSSTSIYYQDFVDAGLPVNEAIDPDESTVAFVSVSSEGTMVDRTVTQAKRIIDAGGTVVMDASGTASGQSHSTWNIKGEGAVQDALIAAYGKPYKTAEGYNYWVIRQKDSIADYRAAVQDANVNDQHSLIQFKVSGVESYGSIVTANDQIIAMLGDRPTSFDMIAAGFRTRTTRSKAKYPMENYPVGSYRWQKGPNREKILTRITAIYDGSDPRLIDNWAKEGWRDADVSAIEKYTDPYSIEFEVVTIDDFVENQEPSGEVIGKVPMDKNGEPLASYVMKVQDLKDVRDSIEEQDVAEQMTNGIIEVEAEGPYEQLLPSVYDTVSIDVKIGDTILPITAFSEEHAIAQLQIATAPGMTVERFQELSDALNLDTLADTIANRSIADSQWFDSEVWADVEAEVIERVFYQRLSNNPSLQQLLITTRPYPISTGDTIRDYVLMKYREVIDKGGDAAVTLQFSETMIGNDIRITTIDGRTIKPSLLPDAIGTVQNEVLSALSNSTLSIKSIEDLRVRVYEGLRNLRQKYATMSVYIKEDPQFDRVKDPARQKLYREMAYALQIAGLKYEDVIENINLLLTKSKVPAINSVTKKNVVDAQGRTVHLYVSDLLVSHIVKNQAVRTFGINRPTAEQIMAAADPAAKAEQVEMTEGRKVETFSDNSWSIATYSSAVNRLKALMGSVPQHTIRFHKTRLVNLILAEPIRRELMELVEDPSKQRSFRVNFTMQEPTGQHTKSRVLIVRSMKAEAGGESPSDKIKLFPGGNRQYGRVRLGSKNSKTEHTVRVLRPYEPGDFESIKPVLVAQRLITEDATSYDGDPLMIYEIEGLYKGEPVVINRVYNKFGVPKASNYKALFTRIEELFVNKQGLSWDEAYRLMSESTDPTIRAVAEKLRPNKYTEEQRVDPGDTIRNNFLTVIQQQQNTIIKTLINQGDIKGESGAEQASFSIMSVDSNSHTQLHRLRRYWQGHQRTSAAMTTLPNGSIVIDQTIMEKFREKALKINSEIAKVTPDKEQALREVAMDFAKEILGLHGIVVTDDVIVELFNHGPKYTKNTGFNGLWQNFFSFKSGTGNSVPSGLFSALISRTGTGENPLRMQPTAVASIAKAVLSKDRNAYTGAVKMANGNRKYPHSEHHGLSQKLAKWATQGMPISIYKQDRMHRSNPWLHDAPLKGMLDSMTLAETDGIQEFNSHRKGKAKGKQEPIELEMTSIGYFFGRGERDEEIVFESMAHSDKPLAPVFRIKGYSREKNRMWQAQADGTVKLNDNAIKSLLGTFMMEYARISKPEREQDKLFYLMPQLNYSNLVELVKQQFISKNALNALYNEDGTIRQGIPFTYNIATINGNDPSLHLIKTEILPVIAEQMIQRQLERWKSTGVISNKYPNVVSVSVASGDTKTILSINKLYDTVNPQTRIPMAMTSKGRELYTKGDGIIEFTEGGRQVTLSTTPSYDIDLATASSEEIQRFMQEAAITPQEVRKLIDQSRDAAATGEPLIYTVLDISLVDNTSMTVSDTVKNEYILKAGDELTAIYAMAADFTLGNFQFTSQVLPLLYGDPALFLKKGKTDAKTIEATDRKSVV
jgi:hypothetical protein